MACRVRNTGKHPLRLDLRNGETVHLKPGETSPALREELLYGNTYLPDWEARGIVARLPAAMSDVLEHETRRAAAAAPAGRGDALRPSGDALRPPAPGGTLPQTGGDTASEMPAGGGAPGDRRGGGGGPEPDRTDEPPANRPAGNDG